MAQTQPTTAPCIAWDPALIARYDTAGPRYTSYPTALQFHEDFTETDYREAVARTRESIAPLSLYLHLPFCEDICYYCACNKVVTRQRQPLRGYLDRLKAEITRQAALFGPRRTVTQLHWGGGSPTFLNRAEMTELMHHTASHFRLTDSPHREYAIEIDPRHCDTDTVALLKGLGFNRASLGVQDVDPAVQACINRIQPFDRVAALTRVIRQYDFKSLSFDLIYGLPQQSPTTLDSTLDAVLSLQPDRIALYNYAHLPERFPSQRAIDRHALPDPATKLAMLHGAIDRLTDAGYRFIGMDHFVREDDDLAVAQRAGTLQRNFQGYSTCMAPDLVGLGVSAISSVGGCFAQNHKDLSAYQAAVDHGGLATARGYRLTAEDRLRQAVIMQLICHMRLDFQTVENSYGIDFQDHFKQELDALTPLIADGLVTRDNRGLTVTETGRLLVRVVCRVFDTHTPVATDGERRHSRVI